jgi:thioredoxin 1
MRTRNALILTAVAVAVVGVAWFRLAREGSSAGTALRMADPASLPASPACAKKLARVVDLGADKCKACKELAPILEQLRKEYDGRVVVDFIDVWKNPDAGAPYKIRVIPTQIFFDVEGKEVWRHEGFLPKADFIAKFAELGVK